MSEQEVISLVRNLHEEKLYRPTMVAVLYRFWQFPGLIPDNKPSFLITQSAKNLDYWGFPQGGIDEGESVEECFKREIKEELGILPEHISNLKAAYYIENLDAEDGRKDRRGFLKGKAYFFSAGEYTGDNSLILQNGEVEAVKWIDRKEIEHFLFRGRSNKANLNKKALERLLELGI